MASAEAQAPLRIGASFSNTGPYAQLGLAVNRGHQLCVKHANEKGGVLGRKIELTAEEKAMFEKSFQSVKKTVDEIKL